MKGKRKVLLAVLLAVLAMVLTVGAVEAAPKYKNQWVKLNGKAYHYNDKGKKDKGLIKIKNKTFYLDSKCVQRTGWQKIDGKYYFFQIRNGNYGYMLTSTTVNGITLTKKGYAKYDSTGKRKLDVMVKANQIKDSITDLNMTKAEKLRKCYDLAVSYKSRNIGSFQKGTANWDVVYAERMFTYGNGDCYCFGAAFAYLANAVGYTDVNVISSGGHGWAEVNGKVYDPNWAKYGRGGKDAYFAVPYSLSNVNGRPNYKPNRCYVKKV